MAQRTHDIQTLGDQKQLKEEENKHHTRTNVLDK